MRFGYNASAGGGRLDTMLTVAGLEELECYDVLVLVITLQALQKAENDPPSSAVAD